MSWFSTLAIDIAKPFHALASLFGSHRYAIQHALLAAEVAATDLNKVAGVFGVPLSVQQELAKISDTLKLANGAITHTADATTLQAQVDALTGLARDLVASGDVHVKNPAVVAQIGVVLAKVQAAVPLIEAAIAADPAVK